VVRRARDAGFATLVVTVDQLVLPKLERDRRNGFGLQFKLTLPILVDACCSRGGATTICAAGCRSRSTGGGALAKSDSRPLTCETYHRRRRELDRLT
jgi:isopentenyl diphosphate isomerase/L-lactate dehydrogenase-like FMN-dependent dehydrogenase